LAVKRFFNLEIRVERLIVFQHTINEMNQFSHHGITMVDECKRMNYYRLIVDAYFAGWPVA